MSTAIRLPVLGSACRAFIDHERTDDPEYRSCIEDLFSQIHPVFSEYRITVEPVPVSQTLLLCWIAVVERFRASRAEGMVWETVAFDEPKRSPRAAIQRLLSHCKIAVSDWSAIEAVLVKDSQEGSAVGEKQIGAARTVPEDQLKDVLRMLKKRKRLAQIDEVFPGDTQGWLSG